MRVAVYLPLLASLIFAAGWPRIAVRRTAPATGVWTLTVGAALCAIATIWSLTLLAATLADDVLPDPYSRLGPQPAGVNDLVGLVAAGLLLTGCVRLVLSVRRQHSTHRDLRRLCERRPAGMVVVADPVPQAFAVPGRGGHIVVSSGMLAALDGPQRRVLIAHERAHLAANHYRHTGIVRAATALNPLLAPVSRASGYLCERSADETAAGTVGDRRLAAASLARAALAAAGSPHRSTALGYGGLGVMARVEALQAPPGGPRGTALRTLLGLGLIGLIALVAAAEIHATGDFLRLMLPFLRGVGAVAPN
jgi:Zn-dependent protease with chaperone function